MFAEERPHLLPLPVEPFRFYEYGQRCVHLDGCVEVQAAYYHAPPGWIGRTVWAQWDTRHVRLLDPRTGQLLREYVPQLRGHRRALPTDEPKRPHARLVKTLARRPCWRQRWRTLPGHLSP